MYSSSVSDVALILLDESPQQFNPTARNFAGWEADSNRFQQSTITATVGIHHPSAHEKMISFDNDPPSFSSNFVDVDDWDVGTTEP